MNSGIYYPEKLFAELYRVLKPGGTIITLCPDWEYNVKCYYEDFTHRTPFTITSLRDIQLIHGFDQIECERFIQLPIVWKYPIVNILAFLVRWLTPSTVKKYFKFVRFSKEIMLLSTSTKK